MDPHAQSSVILTYHYLTFYKPLELQSFPLLENWDLFFIQIILYTNSEYNVYSSLI